MKVKLVLSGNNSDKATAELLKWLRSANIEEVEKIERLYEPPKEGEQGGIWLKVLEIIIGAKALGTLIEKIADFQEAKLKYRQVNVDAEFNNEGKLIKFKANGNPENINKVLDKLKEQKEAAPKTEVEEPQEHEIDLNSPEVKSKVEQMQQEEIDKEEK